MSKLGLGIVVAAAVLPLVGAIVLIASSIKDTPELTPRMDAPPDVPAAPAEGIEGGAGPGGLQPLEDWVRRVADRTEIPPRALHAYAFADLTLRMELPDCELSWATLAGLGRVESSHGQFDGAELDPAGRPTRPIFGVALDGSPGILKVSDTDRGALDGDARYDRAVGPMQFIPTSWETWGTDADGDGTADPQDIDDAALAAGRYLCHDSRDLSTGSGWWAAVLSYNNSTEYAQRVFELANRYADLSRAPNAAAG
jgi:membrane-bound lytic murein transglycosylase B